MHGALSLVLNRFMHSRMLFDPTIVGVEANMRVIQWHASQVFLLLPVDAVNIVLTLKVWPGGAANSSLSMHSATQP